MEFKTIQHNNSEVVASYNNKDSLKALVEKVGHIEKTFTNTNSKLSKDLRSIACKTDSLVTSLSWLTNYLAGISVTTEKMFSLTNEEGIPYRDILNQLIIAGDKKGMLVILTELYNKLQPALDFVKGYFMSTKAPEKRWEEDVNEEQKRLYRTAIQAYNNPLPYLK